MEVRAQTLLIFTGQLKITQQFQPVIFIGAVSVSQRHLKKLKLSDYKQLTFWFQNRLEFVFFT
jgi:hypothetical protein